MKVIKNGKLPEKKIFKGKFSNCKAEYEAEQGELKYHSCRRDGDWWDHPCLTPGCHETVCFSAK